MLKKIYLLFILIFTISCSCFASYENKLAELEGLRYGRTFQNESLSQRLLRLEEDYFGLSQSGDISSRINMLSQIASNNYPNPLSFDRRVYPQYKKQGRIKNFLKDLASAFDTTGVMTGYIPQMDSYDDRYYDDYGNYSTSLNNNYYNKFFNAPKYSPNYVAPHTYNGQYVHQPMINDYNSGYSNSNYYYDRKGNLHMNNRDLYSRSAVKILRD